MNAQPKARHKAAIVEFTGVAGAGKTTLAAAVKDALSEQGFVTRDAYEVILRTYKLNFVRHPRLRSVLVDILALRPFLRHIATEKGRQLFRLATRVIRREAGTFLIAANLLRNVAKRIGVHVCLRSLQHRRGQCDFILCDEGITHIAHNLFVHTESVPDRDEIVRFGNIVPKPDIVIWITAPKEQSIARILQRGHKRVDSSPAAARTFVEHGYFTFNALCSVRSIQDKLFVVDNSFTNVTDKTIRDKVCTVVEFLQKSYLPVV